MQILVLPFKFPVQFKFPVPVSFRLPAPFKFPLAAPFKLPLAAPSFLLLRTIPQCKSHLCSILLLYVLLLKCC